MFNSIITSTGITGTEFIVCSLISLAFGVIVAALHCFRNEYSKSILLTLVILPVVVQTILMLVSGNIGTGIAIAGAFSLIRFRSQPGNSREIASIFLSTTVGLAMALGYVGYAAVLVIIVGIATVVMVLLGFGDKTTKKNLRITIPENLDYEGLFDDIFAEYTTASEMTRVKTVNMGSLFELSFELTMKKGVSEKALIDAIRCRNGNLNVILSKVSTPKEEL